MAFNLLTKKGYSLFEVSSALQKDIRRGHERQALFWAFELEQSNFGAYLWKRLLIISMEDIRPADIRAVGQVSALKSAYDELRKRKSKETNLAIAAVVVFLVRCEKSRLYDWAKCLMVDTHERESLPIPAYAVDMHTARGRGQGKGIEDFFEDGCIINPHTPALLEARYKAEVRELYRRNARSAAVSSEECEQAGQQDLFKP